MVVQVAQAVALAEFQGLGEHFDKALEAVFTFGVLRIIHKNYAVHILLAGSPTFFILKVTAQVPKFDMDLAVLTDTGRRIPLEVDDSDSNGWSING